MSFWEKAYHEEQRKVLALCRMIGREQAVHRIAGRPAEADRLGKEFDEITTPKGKKS